MKMNDKKGVGYDTLSEAMNTLKERGYIYEFDFKDAHLYTQANNKEFGSDELKIVEIHRFEGMSDPNDNSILYAINCADGSRGLLIDAYGMYADSDKTEFLKAVEIVSE